MVLETPLKMIKIQSLVETYTAQTISDGLSKIILDKGYFICYMDNEIVIGRVAGNKLIPAKGELNSSYIKSLRAFNENKEFYLWYEEGSYNLRLRDDSCGEEAYAVEAMQVIVGTKKEEKNGYTRLYEDRGTEIVVPFTNLNIDNRRNRLFLVTRSYIGYTENNIATYIDFRCKSFFNNDNIL